MAEAGGKGLRGNPALPRLKNPVHTRIDTPGGRCYTVDRREEGGKSMLRKITFRVEIFKEARQFVAICPELNVSSFGATKEKAEKSIHEAVSLFLEECHRLGTLDVVLEEAGFLRDAPHGRWAPPDPVVFEKMDVGIPA